MTWTLDLGLLALACGIAYAAYQLRLAVEGGGVSVAEAVDRAMKHIRRENRWKFRAATGQLKSQAPAEAEPDHPKLSTFEAWLANQDIEEGERDHLHGCALVAYGIRAASPAKRQACRETLEAYGAPTGVS